MWTGAPVAADGAAVELDAVPAGEVVDVCAGVLPAGPEVAGLLDGFTADGAVLAAAEDEETAATDAGLLGTVVVMVVVTSVAAFGRPTHAVRAAPVKPKVVAASSARRENGRG